MHGRFPMLYTLLETIGSIACISGAAVTGAHWAPLATSITWSCLWLGAMLCGSLVAAWYENRHS